MDLTAIASAIADRFAAANITPPTGYTDPGTAVYQLPTAITTTPTAVVFPPEGAFSYTGHGRRCNLTFPVRWYLSDAADLPRATAEMYAWAGTLIDQLATPFDLDLAPPVTHAIVDGIRFGKLEYADHEYTGVEMSVVVHVDEAFNPSS